MQWSSLQVTTRSRAWRSYSIPWRSPMTFMSSQLIPEPAWAGQQLPDSVQFFFLVKKLVHIETCTWPEESKDNKVIYIKEFLQTHRCLPLAWRRSQGLYAQWSANERRQSVASCRWRQRTENAERTRSNTWFSGRVCESSNLVNGATYWASSSINTVTNKLLYNFSHTSYDCAGTNFTDHTRSQGCYVWHFLNKYTDALMLWCSDGGLRPLFKIYRRW